MAAISSFNRVTASRSPSGDQAGTLIFSPPGSSTAVPGCGSTIRSPFSPTTAISPLRGGEAAPAFALEPELTATSGRTAKRASQSFTCTRVPASCHNGVTVLLLACEAGLALLDERGHALLRVLGREEVAEAIGLEQQVLDVVALKSVIESDLRGGERERALRGDRARRLQRLRQQLSRLEDRVHEPDAERFVRSDDAAGEDQILRRAEPADPGKALRPAPAGNDPEVDLGLAELRARRRVADVAGECELAASPQREPVHGRDRGLRNRIQQLSDVLAELAPLLRPLDAEPAHVLDVRTRGESPVAGPGQDDHPHAAVLAKLEQAVAQLGQRRDVERVQRFLPVDGEDRDAVLACDVNRYATGTFCLRKSTISLVGAPGVKTSATPCSLSVAASSSGIVPPSTTSTSSASFSFRPSRMRGTSVMWAPERIEIPTASASSWIAVSTICSGVWCSPV